MVHGVKGHITVKGHVRLICKIAWKMQSLTHLNSWGSVRTMWPQQVWELGQMSICIIWSGDSEAFVLYEKTSRLWFCKLLNFQWIFLWYTNDIKDPLTCRILYLAHVRPILEYGSEIWTPNYQGSHYCYWKSSKVGYQIHSSKLCSLWKAAKRTQPLQSWGTLQLKDNILLFKGLYMACCCCCFFF